jgi:hypothetical protein
MENTCGLNFQKNVHILTAVFVTVCLGWHWQLVASVVYFAGVMKSDNINYAGTYDPFRRIIYLIGDGKWTSESMGTFHHAFSSLFLSRHGLLLNPWFE